ncbi:MAG TPA: type II toxin-antitoxin system death-on-curing family toxin [Thermoanaerobaculia bacterium]|nr:type II toxin-antitoxin system death-on-curing family toxin [Thermoanaerobaculia bacterium]
MTVYLSVEQIVELHAFQIERHGGAAGCRDRGVLESAVARPQATFGGEDLYPDLAAKAAALAHSLVLNHPFVDGNRRVGAHAALVFLRANSITLDLSPAELTELILAIARGEVEAAALAIWIRQRTPRTEP